MTDIQKVAATGARYAFALSLLAYALWCLAHEPAAKVTDVHSILAAIALVLLPDLPAHVAAGVRTIGSALLDMYARYKNPTNPTPPAAGSGGSGGAGGAP